MSSLKPSNEKISILNSVHVLKSLPDSFYKRVDSFYSLFSFLIWKDVALAVAWLLSEEAGMVTGSTLAVDGGRSMGGFGL